MTRTQYRIYDGPKPEVTSDTELAWIARQLGYKVTAVSKNNE